MLPGASRAASRFPVYLKAAIAPQCIPRPGVILGGKQHVPTAATDSTNAKRDAVAFPNSPLAGSGRYLLAH